jgi:hypothetical protein
VRKTSESVVHGTGIYSAGVCPKGPTLEKFSDIKKKKKKKKIKIIIIIIKKRRRRRRGRK